MHRVQLWELQTKPQVVQRVADFCAIPEARVFEQLRELNDRIRTSLTSAEDEEQRRGNPIEVTPTGGLRADGIAGLVRLNSQVEIEIVPKFLDPTSTSWRSDFFLLAVLVQTGRVLPHDAIAADEGDRGDLATLVAQTFLASYTQNSRRMIRGYKRSRHLDFAIEGDVEWESIVLPDPGGFDVSRLELSKQNSYNAVLLAATEILSAEVTDTDTQAGLEQIGRQLKPQSAPPAVFPSLPPRHGEWKQTYELAKLVIEGFGLNLDGGAYTGPGFVLSTWTTWQSLCEEVVRRALPNHSVLGQYRWVLGSRGASPVYVTPDITPLIDGAAPLLLDAKYKTRMGRSPRVNSTDLYESLAFMHAANARRIFLLYPALQTHDKLERGEWMKIDHVEVGDLEVHGYVVQIRGLARRDGFVEVVNNTRKALYSIGGLNPRA